MDLRLYIIAYNKRMYLYGKRDSFSQRVRTVSHT